MKTKKLKEISVFIASPGDLAAERKVFKDTIDSLNKGWADGADVKFIPNGWEDNLATLGPRTQDIINIEVKQCNLFILAMHRRWGQPAPDSNYSSYTEEEFRLAFNLWKEKNSPKICVFFKNLDNASMADPGPELTKVLAFRKELEQGRNTFYRMFNTEAEFGMEVDRHLKAFAQGEWENLEKELPVINLPKEGISALNKAKRESLKRIKEDRTRESLIEQEKTLKGKVKSVIKPDLSLVKAYQEELAMARAAVDSAHDGRLQDAKILFAKATEGTTDISILSLAAEFFRQVGDPNNASMLVRRQAAIARDRMVAVKHYFALLPEGWLTSQTSQMLTQAFASFPPELAKIFISIGEEISESERYKKFLFDLYVKYYSTAEILELSRVLQTPEGQSSLQKTQQVMQEAMDWSTKEFERIGKEQYPNLFNKTQMPD